MAKMESQIQSATLRIRLISFVLIESVEKVAELYLLIFDMVPLVGASATEEQQLFLLNSKKCLGLVLRSDLIQSTQIRNFIIYSLREHLKHNLNSFDI